MGLVPVLPTESNVAHTTPPPHKTQPCPSRARLTALARSFYRLVDTPPIQLAGHNRGHSQHTEPKEQTMYFWNVAQLFAERAITWQTAIHALRNRPIAVAGKGGSYIVDPAFEG